MQKGYRHGTPLPFCAVAVPLAGAARAAWHRCPFPLETQAVGDHYPRVRGCTACTSSLCVGARSSRFAATGNRGARVSSLGRITHAYRAACQHRRRCRRVVTGSTPPVTTRAHGPQVAGECYGYAAGGRRAGSRSAAGAKRIPGVQISAGALRP